MEGPRAIRAGELDELMELVNGVFRAGGGRMRECFPTLFCGENLENVRVICEDGRMVSHLGVCVRDVIAQGVRFTVGNVGAVCTHEDYRQRGYAETLLRHFNHKLRGDGVDLLFVSGDRSLYRRHGCARVGRVHNFVIPTTPSGDSARGDGSYGSYGVELLDPARIDDLAAIHQREPVRFHRQLDDWRALTREGNPNQYLRHERRFYRVTGQCGEEAYLVLHAGDGTAGLGTYVTEYAGARGALAGAVAVLAQEHGELRLPVPVWDPVLDSLLRGRGLTPTVSSAGGTVCILNLPQLGEKLRPMFAERTARGAAASLRFEESESGWRVALGADAIDFSREESGEGWRGIACLLFGTPDDAHMADWPDNALTQTLRQALPIARPEYGLSYI